MKRVWELDFGWACLLVSVLTCVQAKVDTDAALQNMVSSESCPNVTCSSPPDDAKCNKTEVENPSMVKRLGSMKKCCPAWKCTEADGSTSLYFGISGEDSTSTSTIEGSSNNGGAEKDKCAEVKCPIPEEPPAADCKVSSSADADDFKPKGDLSSCCSLYNCTVAANSTWFTRFILAVGTLPKESSRRKRADNPKCENMKCAPKPKAGNCEASTEMSNTLKNSLKDRADCCTLWKCPFDDGAYFTHYEITGPNFWMAETSFFSPPPASDKTDDGSGKQGGRALDAQGNSGTTVSPAGAAASPDYGSANPDGRALPGNPGENTKDSLGKAKKTQDAAATEAAIASKAAAGDEDDEDEEDDEDDDEEEGATTKRSKNAKANNAASSRSGSQKQTTGNVSQNQSQSIDFKPTIINNIRQEQPPPPPPPAPLINLNLGK